ncbi:MAG: FAD binding domain-containing protein, partial [Candidatus Acidiferrales bacterium]
MRAYLPDYSLRAPRDLREALQLMDREPGVWKPFAGGTDLMVLLQAGQLAHKKFLSLWHLRELKGIEVAIEFITLGALTTYTDVLRHPVLQQEFPLLW